MRRAPWVVIGMLGLAACGDDARYADRAEYLVQQLTLDEKIAQLHGVKIDGLAYRTVPGVPRLGIPTFNITNGPAGATYGGPGHEGRSTALPAPIALAASWDRELARHYGAIVGMEAAAWGNALLEAPDLNLARVPQGGRTFEAYGEDPYLTGEIAVEFIRGAQAQGIVAEAKHFVANDQEQDRGTVSADISEVALRELYLAPFEAAVTRGEVGAIMCAYNRVGALHMCEHDPLINGVLKREWGFTGFVTSDFYAVHDRERAALGGLDLEMPTGAYFDGALADAVRAGRIDVAVLDDKLVRRYRTLARLGAFQPPTTRAIAYEEHTEAALAAAAEGTVLLVNRWGALPVNPLSAGTIAVIGRAPATGGGGSSHVTPASTVSLVDALTRRLPGVLIETVDAGDLDAARAAAVSHGVVIVMVGDAQTEGVDGSLTLPEADDRLVTAVLAVNPGAIVVVATGGPVLLPWIDSATAVLETWYPGEAGGAALALVLLGDLEPTGRLPISWPAARADLPAASPAQYPGVAGVVHYSEGLLMGYRHYDAHGIAPLFPFGHGLGYTSFTLGQLAVTPTATDPHVTDVAVTFTVTNTGSRTGTAIPQIYVGRPPGELPEPPRWLRGFTRVAIDAGSTQRVTIHLDARAFAHWDTVRHAWVVAPGEYPLSVGLSSRDLRLFATVTVAAR